MGRLPILKSAAATFAYLGRHSFDLFRALWLPALLLVALEIYAAPNVLREFRSVISLGNDPAPAAVAAALTPGLKWLALLSIASLVFYPMLAAGSLRHIIRGETMRGPANVAYGRDEVRILGAFMLLSLMLTLISLVSELAVNVVSVLFLALGREASELAKSLAALAINIAVLWFRLRLSLLFPASMDTRTIGLIQSWETTRGNSWRLLFFWIIVGAFMAALFAIFMTPAYPAIFEALEIAHNAGPSDVAAATAVFDAFAKLFTPGSPMFWPFAAALYAVTLCSWAISGAASGVAWRYLTNAPKE